MPNHIGAFLKASKCFSELGINITRVSYNKAVDSHTLFIEVEGDESQFERANEKLKEIGYLSNGDVNTKIVLVEFLLIKGVYKSNHAVKMKQKKTNENFR